VSAGAKGQMLKPIPANPFFLTSFVFFAKNKITDTGKGIL
jgi:uncharacterized membrane protein YbaN (DUF454 family)